MCVWLVAELHTILHKFSVHTKIYYTSRHISTKLCPLCKSLYQEVYSYTCTQTHTHVHTPEYLLESEEWQTNVLSFQQLNFNSQIKCTRNPRTLNFHEETCNIIFNCSDYEKTLTLSSSSFPMMHFDYWSKLLWMQVCLEIKTDSQEYMAKYGKT